MKIRSGFVSNSSSSSFILRNINMFSEDELSTIKERALDERWMVGSYDDNSLEFSTYQDTDLRSFINQIIEKKCPFIEEYQQ